MSAVRWQINGRWLTFHEDGRVVDDDGNAVPVIHTSPRPRVIRFVSLEGWRHQVDFGLQERVDGCADPDSALAVILSDFADQLRWEAATYR